MLVGTMAVSSSIAPAVKAHKRVFPGVPITHIAIPRNVGEALECLCREGCFMADGVRLEMTTRIVPPPKHIWVGHIV